jgi:hypothetical protein
MAESAALRDEVRTHAPVTHIFMVEMGEDADALARLLAPFAAVQAHLARVEYRCGPTGAVARIEAPGLDPDRAQHLKRRLEQAPCVLRVGLGWSS